MTIFIDTQAREVRVNDEHGERRVPLYSPEAFDLISSVWLNVGWGQRYSYAFTWLGRPVIQLPQDLVRLQEVIYRVRPDVIIETGVAHGGSLVFAASLCRVVGKGRVIGVDIEIRSHNRREIEAHSLASLITLLEGDSADVTTVRQVTSLLSPGENVLVILDSNHSAAHVSRELEVYYPFVQPGSYIIATDGIMRDLGDVPGGRPEWSHDNPVTAVDEFVARHPEFVVEPPPRLFDESGIHADVTYWPRAYLRRTS